MNCRWLAVCKTDRFSVFCKVCKKTFSISGSDISQVKHLSECQKHKNFLKSVDRMQTTIVSSKDGMRLSQKIKWDLAASEKVVKAEIFKAVHVAQYNISFSCAVEYARLFHISSCIQRLCIFWSIVLLIIWRKSFYFM